MKRFSILGCMAVASAALTPFIQAETLTVNSFDYYGPFLIPSPVMIDSVDVNGKEFSESILDSSPSTISLKGKHSAYSGINAPAADTPALHMLSFNFENERYATPSIHISGVKDYTVYLDGKKTDSEKLTLTPSTHNITLRYLTTGTSAGDSLKVELKADNNAMMKLRNDGKRRYTLNDVMHGTKINSVSVSPDGKFMITSSSTTLEGGKSSRRYKVTRLADRQVVADRQDYIEWMPTGSRYYYTRRGEGGLEAVAVDATTGAETVACSSIPDDVSFVFTPDEKSLILTSYKEGKKKDPKVYQIINPEDRQPGWRDRSALSILDVETGIIRPLTFGNRNVFLNDISDDSRKLLVSTSSNRFEKRPTTLFSLYVIDLPTMKAEKIVENDGFIGSAKFSPDASEIVVAGSPEALGGIGKNVPEGRIPSMVDNQLFLIDVNSCKATPLTRDFNPSAGAFEWSRNDNHIYFTAEDLDCVNLFRLDPKSGKITKIDIPEEVVNNFSLPLKGNIMAWTGESASKPLSLYVTDTKKLTSTRLQTPKEEMLADVELGECHGWDFVNSKGDTINGRFYLPPNFDPAKKYPMIVNYYGGCSPTSRNFETRYPHNAYAAQGYVVYVINPGGATGFGQEFSSRHVNTAGEGVAQDIIEGTKKFCEEHPFVNAEKIGCIGASYGGFMTQYLQTVTDIFAAAISHAGISDHTSYWGEGYWGYSYSEVSMADSYPWSDSDLYVKQSPLYNADKIHTPLLFLHGDADVNVPVGESIQMFTALKLLNRPTAFVAVADQDHHILDYDKRKKWQDTIFAWFDRYLKDDPTWWESMYED